MTLPYWNYPTKAPLFLFLHSSRFLYTIQFQTLLHPVCPGIFWTQLSLSFSPNFCSSISSLEPQNRLDDISSPNLSLPQTNPTTQVDPPSPSNSPFPIQTQTPTISPLSEHLALSPQNQMHISTLQPNRTTYLSWLNPSTLVYDTYPHPHNLYFSPISWLLSPKIIFSNPKHLLISWMLLIYLPFPPPINKPLNILISDRPCKVNLMFLCVTKHGNWYPWNLLKMLLIVGGFFA